MYMYRQYMYMPMYMIKYHTINSMVNTSHKVSYSMQVHATGVSLVKRVCATTTVLGVLWQAIIQSILLAQTTISPPLTT